MREFRLLPHVFAIGFRGKREEPKNAKENRRSRFDESRKGNKTRYSFCGRPRPGKKWFKEPGDHWQLLKCRKNPRIPFPPALARECVVIIL